MQSEIQQGKTYRYSTRTLLAYNFVWLLMLAIIGVVFVATTIQYLNRPNINAMTPAMFGVFVVIWVGVALLWVRERPTLELMKNGIFIWKFGSKRVFVHWSDIQSIEDVRRFNVQTGRPLRFFQIWWPGDSAKFNQFYTGLPQLIAQLNDAIFDYGIKVIVHDFEPRALRAAIEASDTAAEKKRLREQGLITSAVRLDI